MHAKHRDGGPQSRHYDTIVLGAGMSGLACASRLLKNENYQKRKTLLVLEGRERIGGRIESIHVNGNRLDTGANWIHGIGSKEHPNPLVQILPNKKTRELSRSVTFRPSFPEPAQTLNRPVDESEVEEDWVKVDAVNTPLQNAPKGDLVIPSHISGDLFGALWTLIGSLREKALNMSPDDAYYQSMLESIITNESFRNAFEDIPTEFHQTLRGLPQFVESMEAAPLCSLSSEHSIDRPGMGLLEYALTDFEGEQVFMCDGYTAVVEEVGKHAIEQGLIKTGVEVNMISWDQGVVVVSTEDETYTATRVVCTFPLGVLKDYMTPEDDFAPPLFRPHLPLDYLEAISSLGFGTLDKIFLVYTRPWWTEDPYASILRKGLIFNPSHDNDDDDDDGLHGESHAEPDSMWGFTNALKGLDIGGPDGNAQSGPRSISIVNLHSLTGFPVLSSFVSCANATYVEGLSDEDARMIMHQALTEWFGQEPPLPDAVHVTRWSQDKFSCGSYTHMITGRSKNSHRETFQRPLVNDDGCELRFAGEHTSLNHFATVHGALLSGWREADAIIESEEKASNKSS